MVLSKLLRFHWWAIEAWSLFSWSSPNTVQGGNGRKEGNRCFTYSLLFSCSEFISDRKCLIDFNNSTHQVFPECLSMATLWFRHRIQNWRCHIETWVPQDSRNLQALVTTMASMRSSWGGLVLDGNVTLDDVKFQTRSQTQRNLIWGRLCLLTHN